MKPATFLTFLAIGLQATATYAHDFPKMDEALPKNIDIRSITPLLDFDEDSCLPSTAVSREGKQNGGLKTTGNIAGGCRDKEDFLEYSNTYYRYVCANYEGKKYCGHMFALYFQKDQATLLGLGHRHDWEHVTVWTTDGVVTHGSASAHGGGKTASFGAIPNEDQHLLFVYHKDDVQTHAMRFADADDQAEAENPYKQFVLPPVVSWYSMQGDGALDNETLRNMINGLNFGSAHCPLLDGDFLRNLNSLKPEGYPTFTDADMIQSK
ncbi:hypothetical protein Poli38472_009944 [Pythium oligandrum]|uniref:Uncharacterized protein n=1 Tax=Pythium oligandrum TaxID=41045 RepID=A0A8K1C8T0_PYTOL|nr:hypothetical protein Poli38472_009944 [Pythium oligandrum]|eukprot:TMW58385.1 hypothetical protein Poli38472_009944 [Pythium oligandrum]